MARKEPDNKKAVDSANGQERGFFSHERKARIQVHKILRHVFLVLFAMAGKNKTSLVSRRLYTVIEHDINDARRACFEGRDDLSRKVWSVRPRTRPPF